MLVRLLYINLLYNVTEGQAIMYNAMTQQWHLFLYFINSVLVEDINSCVCVIYTSTLGISNNIKQSQFKYINIIVTTKRCIIKSHNLSLVYYVLSN